MPEEPTKQGGGAAVDEPGDVGRRIRFWRERRGLSRDDLARQTGIEAGYLAYVETRPTGAPSLWTITRIADAVGTTTAELLGGNAERPSGRSSAARQSSLRPIATERCWALLRSAGIGRLVFDTVDGPTALPANFAMKGREIFVRTQEGSAIDQIGSDSLVSLEVDHIDDAMRSGWSVLLRGTADHLGASTDVGAIFGIRLDPWAGGGRESWLRLRPTAISGREIEVDT
jgi:transcriptional regulator with XRE-family HTH domain